jgi:flagellar protein FliO/FliZ
MTQTPTLDIFDIAIKSASMLAIVIGVLILALYLMKRFMQGRTATNGKGAVKSLATHYFSPRERIEVVDVEGERIVVGIASNGISYLTTLPPRRKTDGHETKP